MELLKSLLFILLGAVAVSASIPLNLQKILSKEYASFFSPFDKSIYAPNVCFVDPLTSFVGVDKYQANVDMLGGRTALGKVLFKDSSISLHKINITGSNSLTTRWTLRTTIKALPWAPTARFTGISEYAIDNEGKIVNQLDYWDRYSTCPHSLYSHSSKHGYNFSVNLKAGKYEAASFFDGLKDFLSQLKDESKGSAELAAPELPYELLRRGARYEVRRYPAVVASETIYDQRPEGYDRLGSYAGGSNEGSRKLDVFSPTLMTIRENNKRTKTMSWPLAYAPPSSELPALETFPRPTIPKVTVVNRESIVVGVTRFDIAATEPVVR